MGRILTAGSVILYYRILGAFFLPDTTHPGGGEGGETRVPYSESVMRLVGRALVELGRAVKAIFLCRYIGSEAVRQEISV